MKRLAKYTVSIVAIGLITCTGCLPTPTEPVSAATQDASESSSTNDGGASATSSADSINYTNWKLLTPEPIPVSIKTAMGCTPPTAIHGPHYVPAIQVYANPIAAAGLDEDRSGPFPDGAIIVKEKLDARPEEKQL